MTEPMAQAAARTFDPATLALLRGIVEVDIETSGGPEAPVHRTTIWVVVDDRDRVLIRTYLGPDSRWYRELRAHPRGRLHADDVTLDVVAEVADDPDRVQACSEGFLAKYARHSATPAMVAAANLPTTLELRPA